MGKVGEKVKSVRIVRVATSFTMGTFGALTIDGTPFCVTLEPPENENQRRISCIPQGQYTCSPRTSSKYGEHWIVNNVPERSMILFHSGNRKPDTLGCILVAQHYGKLFGDYAVLNSGHTMARFNTVLGRERDFHLTITESY